MNVKKDASVTGSKTETWGDLLPQQFYDLIGGPRRTDGARDLMLAVLEDGIRTYVINVAGKTRRQRRLFDEAKVWIDARDDRTPFSFETLCETFDIDANDMRRRLSSLTPENFRRAVRDANRSNLVKVA